MLIIKPSIAVARRKIHRLQSGVVLIIALIILVAMTLASIALVRSVDTNNMIAGNLAFQQAATHSGDAGIETAIAWLQTKNTGGSAVLNSDSATDGYSAKGASAANNPAAGQSWDAFWTASVGARAKTLPADTADNIVSYAIDRMCNNTGSKTGGASCVASPTITAATGNAEEAGEIQLNAPAMVYYRITVRISGPRNTVSYIQAMVSM